MKVLQIIARYNRGGTARWIEELSIGLREQGHDCLIASGNVQSGEIEDPSFQTLNGIRIKHLGRAVSVMSDFKAFFEIRKIIKNVNPDIVNTHTAKAGVLGRLAAASLLKNRPTIVHTYHGHLLYGYFNPVKTYVVTFVEKIMCNFSDLNLAAGDHVCADLISAGIGKSKKFIVVRPGVADITRDLLRTARQKLAIDKEKIVIGWLGRLTQIKRPERLIEIAKRFPDSEFLVGGEGIERSSLEKAAPLNVKFLGWVTPEYFWSSCDIAILTSDNEAQPIALIEASLASLPIVAFEVGSVSEVIENGRTGFLVSDLLEMESKLEELVTNPILREELGNAGRKLALKKFSPEQFVSGHLDAYKAATEQKYKNKP